MHAHAHVHDNDKLATSDSSFALTAAVRVPPEKKETSPSSEPMAMMHSFIEHKHE